MIADVFSAFPLLDPEKYRSTIPKPVAIAPKSWLTGPTFGSGRTTNMSKPTRMKKRPTMHTQAKIQATTLSALLNGPHRTTMVLPSPERPASPAIVASRVGAVVGIEPL